ncbi:hypothetical protein [Bacillus sp. JCM 19034]|uniref:hypothetical protein n=1 Tax=Bacillus sp. JCM 19034 TaxID=1481928 RepID=UPI000785E8CC|nr:hypothetical protein [Bacillus sp. JCM 19034]
MGGKRLIFAKWGVDSPENLPGVDGELEINIETKANEDVDSLFYENYLLQILVTLDSDVASEIEVSEATIANAGKNKQLSFTVMPEQDADIQIKAQVNDFEMDGIEIAAIPPSMALDVPDNELTEDMRTLSDAIEELNDGVGELKDGANELNSGASSLRDGSVQFKDGIGELSSSSADLIKGSETIQASLRTINQALQEQPIEFDLGDFSELSTGLSQMSEGLKEAANGLTQLEQSYSTALSVLDEVITDIPAHQISDQDINSLYASGADIDIINQLIESYTASLTVKGTYAEMKEGLEAIEDNLSVITSSIAKMGNTLATTANELSTSLAEVDQGDGFDELIEGINEIATHYSEFHNGLVSYVDGIGQLSNSYGDLHSGMSELTDGTSEFAEGVSELEDGTQELYDATSDLPEQMQEEIDQMIAEYDKSDLEVHSFVSDKNEHVNTVQFVIQTESISIEEDVSTIDEVEEEEGFWDRLIRLFIS